MVYKRGGLSHEGKNFVVFHYLSTSEILPDKSGGLWWEVPYKRRTPISQGPKIPHNVAADFPKNKILLISDKRKPILYNDRQESPLFFSDYR